jgi:hypothetical protein
MVAELANHKCYEFHGDTGADVNVIDERVVDEMPQHVRDSVRPTNTRIRGIGGLQPASGVVDLEFTISFSVNHLPFETATFWGPFLIVNSLPGNLGGLLGKEFVNPSHAFWKRIGQYPASAIQFFSDTKLPSAFVTDARTPSGGEPPATGGGGGPQPELGAEPSGHTAPAQPGDPTATCCPVAARLDDLAGSVKGTDAEATDLLGGMTREGAIYAVMPTGADMPALVGDEYDKPGNSAATANATLHGSSQASVGVAAERAGRNHEPEPVDIDVGGQHVCDSLPAFGKAQRHDNNYGGGVIISQACEVTGALAPIRYVSWAWPKSQQPWSAHQRGAAALHRVITVEVPKPCP